MGWWQGRLLRDRIETHHERAHARAFPSGKRGRTLRTACLLYVDQTLRRLPEAFRQELVGLADGSGRTQEDLLLTAVLRDGLRYHDVPLGLTGSLVWEAVGPVLHCVPSGADAPILAKDGVVVTRRPSEGKATTVLSWPGSLGGLAGHAGTLAVVLVEADIPVERQMLSELPFTVRLRHALARSDSTEALIEALSDGTAHRVLVADGTGESRATYAVSGLVASEIAYVSDMASAAWADSWSQPEGWSPQGVWLGPEEDADPAPDPEARPRWALTWLEGAWHFRVTP
jgi:hypothetical protein